MVADTNTDAYSHQQTVLLKMDKKESKLRTLSPITGLMGSKALTYLKLSGITGQWKQIIM
jgi:hypothetical protein